MRTAGANRWRAIGATFVCRHISCFVVGKPTSRNRANAFVRSPRSQSGSEA